MQEHLEQKPKDALTQNRCFRTGEAGDAGFEQSAEKKWSLIIIQVARRKRKHERKPGSL